MAPRLRLSVNNNCSQCVTNVPTFFSLVLRCNLQCSASRPSALPIRRTMTPFAPIRLSSRLRSPFIGTKVGSKPFKETPLPQLPSLTLLPRVKPRLVPDTAAEAAMTGSFARPCPLHRCDPFASHHRLETTDHQASAPYQVSGCAKLL